MICDYFSVPEQKPGRTKSPWKHLCLGLCDVYLGQLAFLGFITLLEVLFLLVVLWFSLSSLLLLKIKKRFPHALDIMIFITTIIISKKLMRATLKGTDRESPRRVRLAVIASEKRAKEQYGSLYRCSWFHRCILICANI